MERLMKTMCRLLMKRTKQIVPLIAFITLSLYIAKDSLIPMTRVGFLRLGSGVTHVDTSVKTNNVTLNSTGTPPHKQDTGVTEKRTRSPVIQEQSPLSGCERNALHVRQTCQALTTNNSTESVTLTLRRSKDGGVTFCPIYKVGTTFWRRVFMVNIVPMYSGFTDPYKIPFDKEYPSIKVQNDFKLPGYKVMFSRDPYNRLFSFFVDKLVAPNPVFWKSVGVNIEKFTRTGSKQPIRCAHDVTFKEFIKYVIHTLETRQNIDPHWIEMERNCRPCQVQYDYIGKMEHFKDDALPVIDKMGMTNMAAFLRQNGSYVSSVDAIKDTLQQPFTFRVRYKTCVSFRDAVLRAWHKLQIRGIVGNDTAPAHLLDERSSKMANLVTFAMQSMERSKPEDRSAYKHKVYKDFWHSVDLSDLRKLQKLYSTDFELFGYDREPKTIFDRQNS